MFIDQIELLCKAGDGGNGCLSFRREAHVPRGGPDGGAGAYGGSVVVKAVKDLTNLAHLLGHKHWNAEPGGHGLGKLKTGKRGKDSFIEVPVGTLIYDSKHGNLLRDLDSDGDSVIVAKGGHGGRGNKHFATSINRAPREFETGQLGEQRRIRLDLKLIADVGLVGKPNAGKSTLVNSLVGTKVSIVSPKVQTTRTIVRGIALEGGSQIVFVDTPGIFEGATRRLERAMVSVAWSGAQDADVVLLVVDGARAIEDNTKAILNSLSKRQKKDPRPVMLVVNKVDAAKKDRLLEITTWLNEALGFTETFMVSALSGDGTDKILDVLAASMPVSPWLYPEDDVSDMPQRLLAAEITREKLFMALRQELPYDCAVETETWKEFKDGSARIDQTIYVTRDSQKPIVLGKGGKAIKAVGEQARIELEALLGRRLHLFLHVKVEPKWRERRAHYSAWGLDFDA